MNHQAIRLGIIGAGGNARDRHVPGFSAIPGVVLTGVCNRSVESGKRAAKEFGIARVYDNWLELVESNDIDAICIGTWPYLHCPITLAALDEGKHVLTEARMAMNASEAHAMLETAKANPHLVAQVVPSPFTMKFDRTIQDLIADGFLGELLAIEVQVSQGNFVDKEIPFHWRHNQDLSGYNTLGLGIWYESLLRWIGPAVKIFALTKVAVNERFDAEGALRRISVPDHVDVLCEMLTGAQAHIRNSAITGLSRGPEAWLYGSLGTLRLDIGTGMLFGGRKGERDLSVIEVPPEKQEFWRVEEEFVNAIRGLEPVSRTTFEDGVKNMEFTEAVAISAQEGRTVSLPLH